MAQTVKSKTNRAIVRGLLPDWAYVAEVSADGGYKWSRALRFRTNSDTVAPAMPANLQAGVRGSSFVLTWDAPTTNADGSALKDFSDYSILIYPTGNAAAAVEQTTRSTSFEFTILQNRHFFGTPQGSLTFEVRARDLTFNHSDPATVSVTASPPVAFAIEAKAGPRAIEIFWSNQGVTTFYKVYRSATAGFVPDDATNMLATVVTEADDAIRVSYWDIPPDNSTYYYKVVAVDAFNNTAQSSNEVSGAAEGGRDDTPPSNPLAPVVTGSIHSFTVTQDITNLEPYARFIHVYASEASAFIADAASFVGSIAIPDGAASVKDKFVWVVPSTRTVYVKTRAATKDGVLSTGVSAEASGSVTQGTATYIADAAIGNAHIQEVSASKLMADTAINKNLTVSALLKMGAGGIIESTPFTTDAAGKPTAGWQLTDTTLKMYGSGRFAGTIEADAGWLTNLTVRGNLIVGESGYTGAIQSYLYNGTDNGWKINSGGSAEFYNVTVRGNIQATGGYLQSLNINGRLTLNGGDVYGYYGLNRYIVLNQYGLKFYSGSTVPSVDLQTNGSAIFRGTITSAKMDASEIIGTTITGGTIQTSTSADRVVLDGAVGNNHTIFIYKSGNGGRFSVTTGGDVYLSSFNTHFAYVDGYRILTEYFHNHNKGSLGTSGSSITSTGGPSSNVTGAPSSGSDGSSSASTGGPSDNNTGGASAGTAHYHGMKMHTHTITHTHGLGGHTHGMSSHTHGMNHTHTVTV